MNISLNNLLEQLNLMAAGIKNHPDGLDGVGVDEETSAKLEELKKKLERLNAEQEELKNRSKEKTQELRDEMESTIKFYTDTKKLVKVKAKKINWKAFGIDDKR